MQSAASPFLSQFLGFIQTDEKKTWSSSEQNQLLFITGCLLPADYSGNESLMKYKSAGSPGYKLFFNGTEQVTALNYLTSAAIYIFWAAVRSPVDTPGVDYKDEELRAGGVRRSDVSLLKRYEFCVIEEQSLVLPRGFN